MSETDLMARIEKLEALRSQIAETAIGEDTEGTIERSEPEAASDTLETKKTPPNGNNPMPKSLHGISQMDIELMAVDGNLTGPEQDWYNRRKGPAIDFSHLGPNAWMAF